MVAPGAAVAIAAARSKLCGRRTLWFPPKGGVTNGGTVGAVVALSDCAGCGLTAEALSAFGFRLTSKTTRMTPTTTAPAMIRIRGLNNAGAGMISRTSVGELALA